MSEPAVPVYILPPCNAPTRTHSRAKNGSRFGATDVAIRDSSQCQAPGIRSRERIWKPRPKESLAMRPSSRSGKRRLGRSKHYLDRKPGRLLPRPHAITVSPNPGAAFFLLLRRHVHPHHRFRAGTRRYDDGPFQAGLSLFEPLRGGINALCWSRFLLVSG
jgi:hypothetical protein